MHSEAEPGSKAIGDQAHRLASELLLPAEDIHDLLPTAMGRSAWTTLFGLKEDWGVSVGALLFRARQVGRLSAVSYRNAMIRMSQEGWCRDEPGAVTSIEQPSLMPRAVELLDSIGTTTDELVAQCRVPRHLFEAATARTPMADTFPLCDDPALLDEQAGEESARVQWCRCSDHQAHSRTPFRTPRCRRQQARGRWLSRTGRSRTP